MTYFLLSVTNTCNKSCDYCVVKPWLNNTKYPDKINAAHIIRFLGGQMEPGDIAEITGGEPTLWPDLFTLLDWLKDHGAKVILRTNGINLGAWREIYDNMVVVLARHDSDGAYMAARQKYLMPCDLAKGSMPEEQKQKEFAKPVFKCDEESPLGTHGINRAFHITNDGNIRFMPCMNVSMGNLITGWKLEEWECFTMNNCPYMLGAWNLVERGK